MRIDKIVEGKSVLLIGPGATATEDIANVHWDDWDLIVRVNSHHLNISEDQYKSLGGRTDILYHCFNPDLEKYSDDEILSSSKIVVARNYHAAKRIGTYWIDEDDSFITDLFKKMKSNPSTGVIALAHLCSLPTKRVGVCGMDFYRSKYFYDDDLEFAQSVRNGEHGNWWGVPHKPDVQLDWINKNRDSIFKKMVPIGFLTTIIKPPKYNIKKIQHPSFNQYLHFQTDEVRFQQYSEEECRVMSLLGLNPRSVIDWGCGLGRSAVYLANSIYTDSKFTLYDETGTEETIDDRKWIDFKYTKKLGPMGTFQHSETIPYNDLEVTSLFCAANNFHPEIRRLSDYSGEEVDLFYSFHCVGYHFSISQFFNTYKPKAKVFVFGVRTKKNADEYDVDDLKSIDGYSKGIIKGNYLQDFLIYRKLK